MIAPAAAPDGPAALSVFSSNGIKTPLEDVRAEIEARIGHHAIDIEFSTAAALTDRIAGRAAFDVAILTPALIDRLAAQGRLLAQSRRVIAQAGVGVGARVDAPRLDVSTPETLRRTLLDAESVAFTADGQSRRTIDHAFERLEIVDAMRSKTILLGPGEAPQAVAEGRAELVLTLISEILPVGGLVLAGPLPQELQRFIAFEAAIGPDSGNPAAAALIAELSAPAMTAALEARGLALVTP
jgi:molybdate transport system substrate-binding protein